MRRGQSAPVLFFEETLIALNVAALINGSILVVGASLHGVNESIQVAFQALVGPAGGTGAIMFGGALLLTALQHRLRLRYSGDYLRRISPRKISPLLRRALTLARSGALLLAGVSATSLLVWSKVCARAYLAGGRRSAHPGVSKCASRAWDHLPGQFISVLRLQLSLASLSAPF